MNDYFAELIGNDRVKQYLKRMVEKNAVGNSLLFLGPDGIGKGLFALELAKMVVGKGDPSGHQTQKIQDQTHPDIHVYRPSGKLGLHSIESMRQFSKEVYLPPYEANAKFFIIHDADRMLPYSSNALLKTFEEPSPDSVIILLSSSKDALLPTVLSRCRIVNFEPLKDKPWQTQNDSENPIRKLLLDTLASGKLSSYPEIQQLSSQVSEAVEAIKKEVEQQARKEILDGFNDNLNAVQKETIEKEIEGTISLKYAEEVESILNIILGWFRDLHLLQVNGNRAYLIHPDYLAYTEQTLQHGRLPDLESVQKAIKQTQLAIDRSTSLNLSMESLLLSLAL